MTPQDHNTPVTAFGGLSADDPALLVPLDQLHAHPRNARRGNVNAIAESLDRNTQYKPVTVNRGTHTGRPGEVLAGNHTAAAARALGWQNIAVVWVDVDEDEATRILLTDNGTSDRADYDPTALGQLLLELAGDYAGTPYSPHDADALAEALRKSETPLPTGPTAPLRSDRTRMIRCPHCAAEFDSTAAVETRLPPGGRA